MFMCINVRCPRATGRVKMVFVITIVFVSLFLLHSFAIPFLLLYARAGPAVSVSC